MPWTISRPAEVPRGARIRPALLSVVLLASVPLTAAAGASSQYRLGWTSLDAGGGAAAAATTAIGSSSVGQRASPVIASASSTALESGTPQFSTDTDGDGLLDSVENVLTTSPLDTDTDHDGLTDFSELAADGDPDTYAAGIDTDPRNPDTDGDGIPDGADPEPLLAAATEVPALPSLLLFVLAAALCRAARRFIEFPMESRS